MPGIKWSIAGMFVLLSGVVLIVTFVLGNYIGLYNRQDKLNLAVEDQNMLTAGVAMLHTLPFNNAKLIKIVAVVKKFSEGFLNIYDISNGSSISAQDKQDCVNTSLNPVYKIYIYNSKKDKFISNSLRSAGHWESHITTLLHNILKQSKQLTFVDIGANIGYFSLLSASLGHYAVAVEPWEQNLQKFAQSIYINKFQDKITVFRNAVSNYHRIGYIDIHVAKLHNQGSANLLSDKVNASSIDTITTSTIQLDDLAPVIPTTDIILKFDIEGHECRGIEKSNEIFDTFRVILVLTEWAIMRRDMNMVGTACPPDNIQQTAELLSNRGFVPYSYPRNMLDVQTSLNWTNMDVYWIPKKLLL